jgi:hypothetical protein
MIRMQDKDKHVEVRTTNDRSYFGFVESWDKDALYLATGTRLLAIPRDTIEVLVFRFDSAPKCKQ